MSQFNKRIMELMETDNIEEACKGWVLISESKRDIESVCICGRKIKHIYYLCNKRSNEITNIGSSCVKKLLEFKLKTINIDKTVSDICHINYNTYVNMFEKLTLDEYRELVFSTFCELIDNTSSLYKLENIKTRLINNKNELAFILCEKINTLIDMIDKKIEKIEEWLIRKQLKEKERKQQEELKRKQEEQKQREKQAEEQKKREKQAEEQKQKQAEEQRQKERQTKEQRIEELKKNQTIICEGINEKEEIINIEVRVNSNGFVINEDKEYIMKNDFKLFWRPDNKSPRLDEEIMTFPYTKYFNKK